MSENEQNIENGTSDNVPKPYSKYRPKDDEGLKLNFKVNPKQSLPYLIVAFIFFMSLYLVYLFVDGIIIPSIVHSKDLVQIPNLSGKNLDDGMRILTERGLGYKIAKEIYSEEFPSRTIVNQSPVKGSEVKEGRTVYLTVSKGKETVSAPYLMGMSLSQARLEIVKRGLEIGEINYDFSDYIGKDSVMGQGISGGRYVPFGSVINLTVSQGSDSQIPVPALIGLKYEDVEFLLVEQGFILGNVSYQYSETFTPNTVIEQNPPQGELHLNGTTVDIIVSK